jgi:hypothetical protein
MTRRAPPQPGVDRMVSTSWSGGRLSSPAARQGRALARGLEGRLPLQHHYVVVRVRVVGLFFSCPQTRYLPRSIVKRSGWQDRLAILDGALSSPPIAGNGAASSGPRGNASGAGAKLRAARGFPAITRATESSTRLAISRSWVRVSLALPSDRLRWLKVRLEEWLKVETLAALWLRMSLPSAAGPAPLKARRAARATTPTRAFGQPRRNAIDPLDLLPILIN